MQPFLHRKKIALKIGANLFGYMMKTALNFGATFLHRKKIALKFGASVVLHIMKIALKYGATLFCISQKLP